MKKLLLFAFSICLLHYSSEAQRPSGPGTGNKGSKPSITGSVTEEGGEAISYASVGVYQTSDSSLVTGDASDMYGKFTIPVKPGNYYLKISFLSFKEKTISNVKVGRDGKDLGQIILESSTVSLEEVEVTAERSQMVLQLDKRVLTVGKDLSNIGGNASEILDNIPSVTVDVEGNVSLRGSENVRILIDGKPSGLVGVSSTDALRQMQGNMIDRVEVITNPSARYDAEGEVGIINIILKKDRRKGVNGSYELTAGYPDNYGASLSMNFRREKFNLFTSYGANYRKAPGYGKTTYTYAEGDTAYTQEDREHTRGGVSHNLRLGSDYYVNDYNTLTLSALYRYSDGHNPATLNINDYDRAGDLITSQLRVNDEKEWQHNIELALNHRKTFDQKGREWTSDLKWFKSDDLEKALITSSYMPLNIDSLQRSSTTENEENLLIQTDYIHPIGKNGKFETGLKATMRTIDNDFTVEDAVNEGNWIVKDGLNNHLIYQENIYAAYAIYGNQSGKFSYQGGLRAEYSDIETELVNTQEKNPREYLNLFPSTHFSYKIDSTNTLQLSYSRRLSRPRFRHLLPFYGYSNNRNQYRGNPDLNPEFTNSVEFGHLKHFMKGSILSSVYYRYRTGVIERIQLPTGDGVNTEMIPVNLSTQNAYGLELSVNYDLADWWKANANFNFYRAITDGDYEGRSYYSDTYSWTSRASSKITFLKKLDWQTSLRYRSPRNTTQGKTKSIYSLDMGLAMDVLKGNGTVSLSARDLLNSRKRRSERQLADRYIESEFQWRSRQVLLTFNYRLNQKKKRKRGGDYDGGDDMY